MTDLVAHIPTAVDAVLLLRDEHVKKKNLLDDAVRVYIQVTLHKIPIVEEPKRAYVYLDHCHVGDNPDICIFTKNAWPNDHIVRTPDEKIDFSVDYYQKIFDDHKIDGISGIMPTKQLRNEYGTYELRRKLVNRFDLFLTDTTLLKKLKFTSSLGKIFTKANKFPVGVKFPKPGQHDDNFKKRIEKATKTAYFSIRPSAGNYSIPVGVTSQTREQLIANTTQIVKQLILRSIIPGGFGNINKILLKLERSKPIPLYISLESKNNVPVPYVKAKQPKREDVEGELSTRPGMKVIVTSDGDVIVKKMDDGEGGSDLSDSEDEEEEEEGDEGSDEEVSDKKEAKKDKKTKKKKKDKEGSDDEDGVAENAEEKYLTDWLGEINEDEEEKEKGLNKGEKRKAKEDGNAEITQKKPKVNDKTKGKKPNSKKNNNKKVNVANKQNESPKLEKKGNKGKNFMGKQKKPTQLSKKAANVGNNKKRKQKQ